MKFQMEEGVWGVAKVRDGGVDPQSAIQAWREGLSGSRREGREGGRSVQAVQGRQQKAGAVKQSLQAAVYSPKEHTDRTP